MKVAIKNTNGKSDTNLLRRCGIDEPLYLTCKALIDGKIVQFSMGNPFKGDVITVDKRNAGAYVRAFENRSKSEEILH